MKTKVIIEDGQTTIELIPENQFEKDIIENAKDEKYTIVTGLFNYQPYTSTKGIQIKLIEKCQ